MTTRPNMPARPPNSRGNPNWRRGGPSPNPTGMSAEEQKARDALRTALAAPEMFQAWQAAYLSLLRERNPVIVKDYADRIGGRSVDRGSDDEPRGAEPPSVLMRFKSSDELLEAIRRTEPA